MRIAYIVKEDAHRETGVTKKILDQTAEWRRHGASVQVFALVRAARADSGPPFLRASLFPYGPSPLARWRATTALARAVRDASPDVLYVRYFIYSPGLAPLLRELPVVVEVNSDDVAELAGHVGQAWYNRVSRRRLFGNADGLVTVTEELARNPVFASFGLPTEVVANGFDLSRVEPAPPPDGARPRLFFTGAARRPWHGVDKVLELAERLPEFDFTLVGTTRAELGRSAPPNASVHGPQSGRAYTDLLAEADVGVGSLALHRNGMEEACPLKVREYLAYGLPVVIAYRDTDLPEGGDYVLRLPNTEDGVAREWERVREFVRRVKGRRVPRDWVAARIDAREKEARRLRFLEERVRRSSKRGAGAAEPGA